MELATKHGLDAVTREMIAEAGGVSPGLVSWRFTDMPGMRHEIIKVAVKRELLNIIAQGLTAGYAAARRAPIALRERALMSLIGK